MIFTYNFSLQGRSHKKSNMPCHDYSLVKEVSPSWKIAVVADGVGACKHAEIASRIAAETVADLIKRQFPMFSEEKSVYESVILAAMNGAANAIEEYVEEYDTGNEIEYQTTLAVAIMSRQNLYYGNAGDSGIIALDDEGNYHILSTKQNDEEGRVFSIPMHRNFEIGTADFTPVVVLSMTDGVLDYVVPTILGEQKYKVNVPFANLFSVYGLSVKIEEEGKISEECKKRAVEYLTSDACKHMVDDLSVAAMFVTDSYLQAADIKWEEPDVDYYKMKWKELSVYQSEKIRLEAFSTYIKEINPELNDEQINDVLRRYSECDVEKTVVDEINECDVEKMVVDEVSENEFLLENNSTEDFVPKIVNEKIENIAQNKDKKKVYAKLIKILNSIFGFRKMK